MKKLLFAALLWPILAFAQYPSPTYQNLTVLGTLTFNGNISPSSLSAQASNTVLANVAASSASPTAVALPSCSGANSALKYTSASGFSCGTTYALTGGTLAQFAATTSAQLAGVISDRTGSGSLVFGTNPVITGATISGGSGAFTTLSASGAVSGAGFSNFAQLGAAANFTTLSASSTVSGAGFTSLLAPYALSTAIGGYYKDISISPPVTLNSTDYNSVLSIASGGAATLPSGSGVPAGTAFHFAGRAWGSTIVPHSGDTLYTPYGSAASVTLNTGDEATYASDGLGGWIPANLKHAHCANILDYGGNNTAGAANDSAWTNAMNAQSSSSQICVYFPAGYYNFSNQISYTFPNANTSLTIEGDGAQTSILNFTNASGIYLQKSASVGISDSFHIRHLSLLAGTAGTGTAISLYDGTNNANPTPSSMSDITDVDIHGNNGYPNWGGTNWWAVGVFAESWSNINFVGLNVQGGPSGGDLTGYTGQGTGVDVIGQSGSSAPPQGVQFNFTQCQFNYLQYGIEYSNWSQGVNVSQSNFVGGKFGIYVNTPNQGQDQLTIVGNQFNNSDAGVIDNAGVPGIAIIGNYFLIPTPASSNAGVQLVSEWGGTVSGNTFQRIGASTSGTNGVVVGAPVSGGGPVVVTGNFFKNLGTGVFLQAASSSNNVQANVYSGNTSNVVNSGSGNSVGLATP